MHDKSEQTDMEFEENDESNESLGAATKITQLRQQLKEALGKRDEYLTGWQRSKADSINSRKEIMADAERRAERDKLNLIENIIPVIDSFDMAVSSDAWSEVADGFRSGMEQVRNQLLDVLSRNGVERYGKIGEQFDPRIHEAVHEVDDAPGEPHSIVKILRYGYRSGDTVLRPSHVIVKSA